MEKKNGLNRQKPLVMKFGGSSVGTASAIMQTVDIISKYQRERENVVVVVSAMSGVTNLLIDCAQKAAADDTPGFMACINQIKDRHLTCISNLSLSGHTRDNAEKLIQAYLEKLLKFCRSIQTLGEVTPRGMDAIASLGERMNARQVTALLSQHHILNQPMDADQLIITDDIYQKAHPDLDLSCQKVHTLITPLLKENIVPVITGFISGTKEGITTTLGRGGSDYTAAILGNCLDAGEVWTWTDVDGVMTADPSVVLNAKVISNLTFDEVSEMAYFGAKVLHPKTIRPLSDKGIPLWVKNTFNPASPGTCISDQASDKPGRLSCVTTIRDVSLVTVHGKGMLGVPGVAARTFSAVAKQQASVLMISQSSSEQSICFVIPGQDETGVIRSIEQELEFELTRRDIDSVNALSHVVIVTAIGAGMRKTPGVSAKIFSALALKHINVLAIAQGSSDYSISMVIAEEEANEAVKQIHTEVIINGK